MVCFGPYTVLITLQILTVVDTVYCSYLTSEKLKNEYLSDLPKVSRSVIVEVKIQTHSC